MPKRKEPPLTPEAQHAKFVQAVHDIEAAGDLRDDADERFERALSGARREVVDDKTAE
jgi:hypothetical protein